MSIDKSSFLVAWLHAQPLDVEFTAPFWPARIRNQKRYRHNSFYIPDSLVIFSFRKELEFIVKRF